MSDHECVCDPETFGHCELHAMLKSRRQKQICRGENVTPDIRRRYMSAWEEQKPKDGIVLSQSDPGKPTAPINDSRENVGTRLAEIIKKQTGFDHKIPGNAECGCGSFTVKMNSWGIAGCESRREEITDHLADQAGIAKKSEDAPWFLKALKYVPVPRAALKMVASEWLDSAISEVKAAKAKSAADAKALKEQRAKESKFIPAPKHWSKSFIYDSKQATKFLTTADICRDAKRLASMLPSDVKAIAGVARSGLYPASMIAMILHLPLLIVRQTKNDVVDGGSGWRLGHAGFEGGLVAVIDDTVMTGNSQKSMKALLDKEFPTHISCSVYCNPKAAVKPDLWAVDLPWPHLLEWNIFNSVLTPSMAVDFDGILCRDCRAGEDDDGDRYMNFIETAEPLYPVRKSPIPLVVTARLEKYRKPTEAWLEKWGIKVNNLVMSPYTNLADRQRSDVAKYKAIHFKKFLAAKGGIRPKLFIESCPHQAKTISRLSGGMTVCPATAAVFKGK